MGKAIEMEDLSAIPASDADCAAQEQYSAAQDERGMTTAEYAVGTVAAVSFVGVIIGILQNEQFRNLIWEIIKAIFQLVTGQIPLL